MAEEKFIQFIANYDDWVSIKKLKITEAMDSKTVMEFLASLTTGIDGKVEANLKKILDIGKLDSVLKEALAESGKGIGETIQTVNGAKVNKVVNELVEGLTQLQANEKKELSEFLKVYAMRKALRELKVRVDYSEINIPGMKRLKKAKV